MNKLYALYHVPFSPSTTTVKTGKTSYDRLERQKVYHSHLGADGFCSNLFSQCAAFNDYDHNQYLTVLTRQHLNVKNAHHSTLRQQSGLRNLS